MLFRVQSADNGATEIVASVSVLSPVCLGNGKSCDHDTVSTTEQSVVSSMLELSVEAPYRYSALSRGLVSPTAMVVGRNTTTACVPHCNVFSVVGRALASVVLPQTFFCRIFSPVVSGVHPAPPLFHASFCFHGTLDSALAPAARRLFHWILLAHARKKKESVIPGGGIRTSNY